MPPTGDSSALTNWAQGDGVLASDGTVFTLRAVSQSVGGAAAAYNFKVDGIHTYHVGERGILVHNTCALPQPATSVPRESREVVASIRETGVIWQSGIRGPSVPKVFNNLDGALPSIDSRGVAVFYRERGTVPSAMKNGGERIVTSSTGRAYYSPDHYKTFVEVP